MYIINAYELADIGSESYILSSALAAKISSSALIQILITLNQQKKREITEEKLVGMALDYKVDIEALKQLLIAKLAILKPFLSRKIPTIYLNSEDELVEKLLGDTLNTEYEVLSCANDIVSYSTPALVIYYRKNYTDPDFKSVYLALKDEVYLITCGVLHQQLVIDNIYFNHSGLPTHNANLHNLMRASTLDSSLNHKDGLSFYRELYKRQIKTFPSSSLNPCQRAYIAYSIYQYVARFVKFDGLPTPHDALNWRWQVDLLKFGVQKEVAILEEQI